MKISLASMLDGIINLTNIPENLMIDGSLDYILEARLSIMQTGMIDDIPLWGLEPIHESKLLGQSYVEILKAFIKMSERGLGKVVLIDWGKVEFMGCPDMPKLYFCPAVLLDKPEIVTPISNIADMMMICQKEEEK